MTSPGISAQLRQIVRRCRRRGRSRFFERGAWCIHVSIAKVRERPRMRCLRAKRSDLVELSAYSRPSSPLKNALLRLRHLRRCCVGLVDPCSAALQGRFRGLDFALLAATNMASSRYGPFSTDC